MVVKNFVKMPRKDYLSEHARLITLLDNTSKKLKAEANSQKREIKDERRKRKVKEPKSN